MVRFFRTEGYVQHAQADIICFAYYQQTDPDVANKNTNDIKWFLVKIEDFVNNLMTNSILSNWILSLKDLQIASRGLCTPFLNSQKWLL